MRFFLEFKFSLQPSCIISFKKILMSVSFKTYIPAAYRQIIYVSNRYINGMHVKCRQFHTEKASCIAECKLSQRHQHFLCKLFIFESLLNQETCHCMYSKIMTKTKREEQVIQKTQHTIFLVIMSFMQAMMTIITYYYFLCSLPK